MASVLSLLVLAICAGMLVLHFLDIKKSHKRNGG